MDRLSWGAPAIHGDPWNQGRPLAGNFQSVCFGVGRKCRKARQEEMVRIYGYWWLMVATDGRDNICMDGIVRRIELYITLRVLWGSQLY